jgi:hypothetical protein
MRVRLVQGDVRTPIHGAMQHRSYPLEIQIDLANNNERNDLALRSTVGMELANRKTEFPQMGTVT